MCILGGGMHLHTYGEARDQHCLLKIIPPLFFFEIVSLMEPGAHYVGQTD